MDAVKEVTPPDYAVAKAGRVNTKGDAIHRADLVRTFSGISGSGVKVGVISDGVDTRRTSQSSNDLPDSIEVDPNSPGSGDEGTALLEIVHDLAPRRKAGLFRPRHLSGYGRINPLAGQRSVRWRRCRHHCRRLHVLSGTLLSRRFGGQGCHRCRGRRNRVRLCGR